MATATKAKRVGIRGTTKSKEVLEEPKRKLIIWSNTEKDAIVGHALPIFQQMVEEGMWKEDEPRTWVRHLLESAQGLALPPERRRPVDHAPYRDMEWFRTRIKEAHEKSVRAIVAARMQAEEAAKEAEVKEAKKAEALYQSRELDEGYTKPRKTKVYWTDEEKAAMVEAGARIRRADPRRSDLAVLRKAQNDALPPERHRALGSVAREQFQWFLDGIETWTPPEEVVPKPEPVPVDPLDAAMSPETAFPYQVGLFAPLAAVNRAMLGAVVDMMMDIRASSELMRKIAEDNAANRRILAKVVQSLDPTILEGEATVPPPALEPQAITPPAPPPPMPPPPVATVAPPPAPPVEDVPKIPHQYKPKVAIVGPHMTQVKHLREVLSPYADIRIFATGKEAKNARFSNSQYIVFTSMVGNDVVRMAEHQLHRDKIARPANNGAEAIIDVVMKFSHKHVAEMQEKDRLAQEAKDRLKAQYLNGATNGQTGLH